MFCSDDDDDDDDNDDDALSLSLLVSMFCSEATSISHLSSVMIGNNLDLSLTRAQSDLNAVFVGTMNII